MSKNAIIVHGKPPKEEYYSLQYPSSSNFHWLPWLQKSLLVQDIPTATPEIPHAYNPQYEIWKREFERFDISPETILVGHSCGAGFLVRWLSEHTEVQVGDVFLVAPWIDPREELTTGFFDFTIDESLGTRTKSITIFNSDDDFDEIQESVELLRSAIPSIEYVGFHGEGHFVGEKFVKNGFPELLQKIREHGN